MQTSKAQELLTHQNICSNENAVASKAQENTLQDDIKNTSLQSLESTPQSSPCLHIPPHIDYLIFLDSDDYWERECIEECVRGFAECEEEGDSIELFIFDSIAFFDGITIQDYKPKDDFYGYSIPQTFSARQWLDNLIRLKQESFTIPHEVCISFDFLKKINLRFLNGVICEDVSFSIMLFMQSNQLRITPKKFYHYRLRPDSITFQSATSIAPYLLPFYKALFKDIAAAKEYHGSSSRLRLFLQLLEFFDALEDKEFAQLAKKTFLPCLAQASLKILNSAKDPLNLLPNLDLTKPYITSGLSLFARLYLRFPKARGFLLFFKRAYEIQRIFERKIRRKIFKKYKQ